MRMEQVVDINPEGEYVSGKMNKFVFRKPLW